MTQTTNSYAYRAELDLPIDAAIEKVTAALKEEGFGILTEIDIKSTLKKTGCRLPQVHHLGGL